MDKSKYFERDVTGRTRLFYAVEKGDIEEVRQIIFSLAGTGLSCQRLALINIEDLEGLTAIDVAKSSGQKNSRSSPRGKDANGIL
jgi:hypothetical protein